MHLRLCAAQLFALGGCVCGAFSTTAPAQVFRVPIDPASMLSDLTLPGETLAEQSVLAISPEGDIMTRVEPSGGSSRVYLIRDGQAPQLLLQAGAAVPSTLDRLVVSVRSASFGRADPLTNERPLRRTYAMATSPVTRDGRFVVSVGSSACVAPCAVQGVYLVRVAPCSDIDFDNDGIFPSDDDLVRFLGVLAGADCVGCDSIDFNGDGIFPSDEDLLAYPRVLAGGVGC